MRSSNKKRNNEVGESGRISANFPLSIFDSASLACCPANCRYSFDSSLFGGPAALIKVDEDTYANIRVAFDYNRRPRIGIGRVVYHRDGSYPMFGKEARNEKNQFED